MIEKLAGDIKRSRPKDMMELVALVHSTDAQLGLLFDEHATLKFFEWPEGKFDCFREATALHLEFCALQVGSERWRPPRLPCTRAPSAVQEPFRQNLLADMRTQEKYFAAAGPWPESAQDPPSPLPFAHTPSRHAAEAFSSDICSRSPSLGKDEMVQAGGKPFEPSAGGGDGKYEKYVANLLKVNEKVREGREGADGVGGTVL